MACYTLTAGRAGLRTSDPLLVGTAVGALGTIPAVLLQGDPWSPLWAVVSRVERCAGAARVTPRPR